MHEKAIGVGDTVWPKPDSCVCRFSARTVHAVYDDAHGRWLWLVAHGYSPETHHASAWTTTQPPAPTHPEPAEVMHDNGARPQPRAWRYPVG